jgi:hypothetical protein
MTTKEVKEDSLLTWEGGAVFIIDPGADGKSLGREGKDYLVQKGKTVKHSKDVQVEWKPMNP